MSVSAFLGGNRPSRTGDVRGDISVNFSCDPDISTKLVCSTSHLIYYAALLSKGFAFNIFSYHL